MKHNETIADIRRRLREGATPEELIRWSSDERRGVRQALVSYQRQTERRLQEETRLHKLYQYERRLYAQGYRLVAGTDEAGRGPVAGPVTVGAVILPAEWYCVGLNDSKQLRPEKREELYHEIVSHALAYKVIHISAAEIDAANIYQVVQDGMSRAIAALQPAAQAVLSDAMPFATDIPLQAIVHGDALSASIAAASILAKVSRDRLMCLYDEEYPGYHFAVHKGYLTELHRHALEELGPCPIHRASFEPIKSMLKR